MVEKFAVYMIIGSEILMIIQNYFENQLVQKKSKSNKNSMKYIAILAIIGSVMLYFKKWTTWPYLVLYLAAYVIGTILNYKHSKATKSSKIIYPIFGFIGLITLFSLLY